MRVVSFALSFVLIIACVALAAALFIALNSAFIYNARFSLYVLIGIIGVIIFLCCGALSPEIKTKLPRPE